MYPRPRTRSPAAQFNAVVGDHLEYNLQTFIYPSLITTEQLVRRNAISIILELPIKLLLTSTLFRAPRCINLFFFYKLQITQIYKAVYLQINPIILGKPNSYSE
jgi:hypothetical protein